jgi:hypothetical protein
LAHLVSAPEGLQNIVALDMSWWGGGPAKVMTVIWAHLLILVGCGLVMIMLQAMIRKGKGKCSLKEKNLQIFLFKKIPSFFPSLKEFWVMNG